VKIENNKAEEISLFNSLGQTVHKQKVSQGLNEIKTEGLCSGLYNCVLMKDNRSVSSSKISIE
jgi:hypothetical protein